MLTQELNSLRGQNALVLGAGGFIGQHVADLLMIHGAHVVGVVRSGQGSLPCTTIEADLGRHSEVHAVLQGQSPDLVFNLAAYGVDPSQSDEALAHALNAELPRQLSKEIEDQPKTRLIHVGSAAEYGVVAGDLSEDGTCKPTSLYGRTKLAGTNAVVQSQSNAIVTRLFTVYGEGEKPYRLLPQLMQAAQEGSAIDLTNGIQERDFTCVHDVAEGLLRLALCPHPPKLLNLGTGRLLSVREFCRVAANVLAMPEEHLRFGTRQDRDDEMKHEPVNISRLTSALEWQPTNDVREGIQRAWNARIEKGDP